MTERKRAAGRRQADPTAEDDRPTLEVLKQLRRGRKVPCAVRGCRAAGVVGPSRVGNRFWFCWPHFIAIEGAE